MSTHPDWPANVSTVDGLRISSLMYRMAALLCDVRKSLPAPEDLQAGIRFACDELAAGFRAGEKGCLDDIQIAALAPEPQAGAQGWRTIGILAETVAELRERLERAETEAYELKLAAAGGEDVPGSANMVTAADVHRWTREAERRAIELEARALPVEVVAELRELSAKAKPGAWYLTGNSNVTIEASSPGWPAGFPLGNFPKHRRDDAEFIVTLVNLFRQTYARDDLDPDRALLDRPAPPAETSQPEGEA